MPHKWREGTQFVEVVLDVEDELRQCPDCDRRMTICDHRFHPIYTLKGPRRLVCRLVKCPNRDCPRHHRTVSPQAEAMLCTKRSILGWDVFCWVGHRRFARHWSVPQIAADLKDTYDIPISVDALEEAVTQYQTIVAAREQDFQRLAEVYRDADEIVLSIDGLQPEKGHETLYVVRELTHQRVWFGQALVCSSEPEVRRLIAQAREWAKRLGKTVRCWMSDKQDAFVTGIAAEFPDVPHRFCQNHFIRDVAKPVLEADSHAKVRMRSKVRGLRTIERELLAQSQMPSASPSSSPSSSASASPSDSCIPQGVERLVEVAAIGNSAIEDSAIENSAIENSAIEDSAIEDSVIKDSSIEVGLPVPPDGGEALAQGTPQATGVVSAATAVVLDYCTAVKGILNDDQGGPLQPSGLRMAAALTTVRESLERNIQAKKGALRRAR